MSQYYEGHSYYQDRYIIPANGDSGALYTISRLSPSRLLGGIWDKVNGVTGMSQPSYGTVWMQFIHNWIGTSGQVGFCERRIIKGIQPAGTPSGRVWTSQLDTILYQQGTRNAELNSDPADPGFLLLQIPRWSSEVGFRHYVRINIEGVCIQ